MYLGKSLKHIAPFVQIHFLWCQCMYNELIILASHKTNFGNIVKVRVISGVNVRITLAIVTKLTLEIS